MDGETIHGGRWLQAVHTAHHDGALTKGAQAPERDDDVRRVWQVSTWVWDYLLEPANRTSPYRRWFSHDHPAPSELTPEEEEIVSHIAAVTDLWRMRVRCLDVVAVRSSGAERWNTTLAVLRALNDSLPADDFAGPDLEVFDRAVALGSFSKAHREVTTVIESKLVRMTMVHDPVRLRHLSFSRHLRQTLRARSYASQLAAFFATLADASKSPIDLEEAAEWAFLSGERRQGEVLLLELASSLQREAHERIEDDEAGSAAYALELIGDALKAVRRVPGPARRDRGVEGLSDKLQADSRRAALVLVGHSTRRSIPLPDVGEWGEDLRDRLTEASKDEDARALFLTYLPLTNLSEQRVRAAETRRLLPLVTDVRRTTIESGGRVSSVGAELHGAVYDVPAPIWHQMMRQYEERISVAVFRILEPAWQLLSGSRRWTRSHFIELASGSAVVPHGRAVLIGRALSHGFDGDFLTACQLLVPQLENFVRHHLTVNGIRTSRIVDGVDSELSLPALLESAGFVRVFEEDLAFELRALFGGEGGPNLRHSVAHGLMSDDAESSPYPFYVWWLMWRIVSGNRAGLPAPL